MNITACSSHGSIEFDSETGIVFSQHLDNCEDCPDNIGRFDVEEYKKFYGVTELPAEIDILDLGYWLEDESYEEPAHDWRIERDENIRGELDLPTIPKDKKVMVKVDLQEIAFIGVVMGDYITNTLITGNRDRNLGVITLKYLIADWAVEFYQKFKNVDWEQVFENPPMFELPADVCSFEDAIIKYVTDHYCKLINLQTVANPSKRL